MREPPARAVSYAVEGLDPFGNWSAVTCWDLNGHLLNPTPDEASARAFYREMCEELANGTETTWRAVRLARSTTLHEVIEQPSQAVAL